MSIENIGSREVIDLTIENIGSREVIDLTTNGNDSRVDEESTDNEESMENKKLSDVDNKKSKQLSYSSSVEIDECYYEDVDFEKS